MYVVVQNVIYDWQKCIYSIALNLHVLCVFENNHISIHNYTHNDTHIYIYIISRRSITPQHIKYKSKSLNVVQSLYFGSKLPSSGTYKWRKNSAFKQEKETTWAYAIWLELSDAKTSDEITKLGQPRCMWRYEGWNFASFVSLYLYVPDEGSLLPKYRDCTTSNDFELYI